MTKSGTRPSSPNSKSIEIPIINKDLRNLERRMKIL